MDRTLTSLKKIKDPFFRGEEFRAAETSQTNKELTDQKLKLLQEINKLSNIYFSLKKGSEKVKKDIVGFETDRIKTLELLGKEVSLELDEEAGVLKKRSEDLDEKQRFLEELMEYAQELVLIGDSLSLANEVKSVEIQKLITGTSKESKRLEDFIKKYERMNKRAKNLLETAERKHKVADNLLKEAQEETTKEKSRLEKWAKMLEAKGKKVVAGKRTLKAERERLESIEKRLLDKEATLKRSARELERKRGQ